MSRLAPLPYDQWDPALKAMFGGAEPSEYNLATTGIMAHAPHVVQAQAAFSAAMKANSLISPRLRELVRLRVAFHNQCRTCMAVRYQAALDDGLTEGLVCSLEKPEEAPDLTPAEKAALAYADLASTNHFAIDEAMFARLAEHFTPGQIIELGVYVGSAIGFGRFAACLHMVDSLPDRFKEGEQVAPWTHAPALVPG
jgi:AhpD family alkylhydroperoxidase